MHDHDCDRVFALLSEYLDQNLGPATCEELEIHLAACPECVDFVRSLKRSMQLCGQLGNCLLSPSLDSRMRAGLRRAYEDMLARRRVS